MDIPSVGVSALIALDDAGRISRARLALGAVAPVPLRAIAAEEALVGHPATRDRFAAAAALAAAAASPISDVRASAEYRKRMIEVLVIRALERATTLAGGCHV